MTSRPTVPAPSTATRSGARLIWARAGPSRPEPAAGRSEDIATNGSGPLRAIAEWFPGERGRLHSPAMMTELAPAPAPSAAPVERPRIFSGIQPSGIVHLGNDLGAIRNYVRLQRELRGDLLHRRLPRPDQHPRAGLAALTDARDGGVPPGARPGSRALHPVRPEPPARAYRACLAVHDRDAGQLAGADADLQGKEAEAARRHQPRAAHLPGPAGGRHRHLQGLARPGRQGPGRPSRAEPRDRPDLQQPLRRDLPRSRRPSSPRRPPSSGPTASGR